MRSALIKKTPPVKDGAQKEQIASARKKAPRERRVGKVLSNTFSARARALRSSDFRPTSTCESDTNRKKHRVAFNTYDDFESHGYITNYWFLIGY